MYACIHTHTPTRTRTRTRTRTHTHTPTHPHTHTPTHSEDGCMPSALRAANPLKINWARDRDTTRHARHVTRDNVTFLSPPRPELAE